MRSIRVSLGLTACAVALAGLAACSKPEPAAQSDNTAAATTTETPAAGNETAAATPAAAAGKPAADNTDTLDGTKFASFTGTAAAGEKVFAVCKTCHAAVEGKNMVGPSLWNVHDRPAGQVAGFNYTAANKNSGIVWSNEKLFQYLESPQRVVPGTKMSYTGLKDAQKRADLIAYLDTLK
jgi:cytochrome c